MMPAMTASAGTGIRRPRCRHPQRGYRRGLRKPQRAIICWCWLAMSALLACPAAAQRPLVVGSKAFAESHLLAEISAQLLEANGFAVQRKLALGGSLIVWQALLQGGIDLYPEYSGTLRRAILQQPALSGEAVARALAGRGLRRVVALGFDNTYALATPVALARTLGLRQISDLQAHPSLRLGFSLEFLNREDGWPALQRSYALPQQPTGLEHALAYRALAAGQLDVTDAYSTDGELAAHSLQLLEDDRGVFPDYRAMLLGREDLPPRALSVLGRLQGRLDAARMRALNQRIASGGETPAQVAADFLEQQGLAAGAQAVPESPVAGQVLAHTLTHLKLAAVAVLLGCVLAIPLSVLVSRRTGAARALQYVAGLVQTVPALALLALMIPLLGLGQLTAISALFLYSLLPIVRNTLAGLLGIDPLLREVGRGLGLSPRQQLWHLELPLAAPMILAGVRTAAVISIGTATLAAFVGAGGLGEPIITGLTLNDPQLILQGALPAAALALAVELLFEGLERLLLPAHLRIR